MADSGLGDISNAEALQAQLHHLKALSSQKQQQIKAIILEKRRIDAAFDKTRRMFMYSARSECRELCAMMYKKLPFELRNVVYSYLCLEDRHIPIGPYYHFRKYESPNNDNRNSRDRDATNPLKESDIDSDLAKYGDREYGIEEDEEVRKDAQTVLPDGRIRTDHDVYPPSDYVMPKDVIFKSSYMGEKVALEALKFYYANNSFSICNVDGGLKLLFKQELLQPAHDALLVGFAPIDHVRNLQIRVKCEHFMVLTELPSAPTELRLNQFIEEEHFLRRTVESLTDFRRRILTSPSRELNIEIVLMSDLTSASATGDTNFRAAEWMHYRITNFLQTIRNCVYELIHDRDQTTVQVIHQDDGLMAFPKNYTGLFQLTKNQWDYEKSKQQPNHDWTHDFWVVPLEPDEIRSELLSVHGSYFSTQHKNLLRERWGIGNILRETISTSTVVEGLYWPVRPSLCRDPATQHKSEL